MLSTYRHLDKDFWQKVTAHRFTCVSANHVVFIARRSRYFHGQSAGDMRQPQQLVLATVSSSLT